MRPRSSSTRQHTESTLDNEPKSTSNQRTRTSNDNHTPICARRLHCRHRCGDRRDRRLWRRRRPASSPTEHCRRSHTDAPIGDRLAGHRPGAADDIVDMPTPTARRGRRRGQPDRLGRLRRGRVDRSGRRLGHAVRGSRPAARSTYKLGNSSDEMVQLMQTGEYDGVSASGDATLRLIAGGEVVTRQHRPDPELRRRVRRTSSSRSTTRSTACPTACRTAAAPTCWCSTPRPTPTAPDSWGEMFEASTAAPGAVSIYDSPIYIADAALYLMATQPELGITNPYALDQTQFDAAIALLGPAEGRSSASTGRCTPISRPRSKAARRWSAPPGRSSSTSPRRTAPRSTRSSPKEGATGWSDTWMISSKAAHPNCMYMWMDHIISAAGQRRGRRVVRRGTVQHGELRSHRRPGALRDLPRRGDGVLAGRLVLDDARRSCLDGRTDVKCVPYTEWVNAWNGLRELTHVADAGTGHGFLRRHRRLSRWRRCSARPWPGCS